MDLSAFVRDLRDAMNDHLVLGVPVEERVVPALEALAKSIERQQLQSPPHMLPWVFLQQAIGEAAQQVVVSGVDVRTVAMAVFRAGIELGADAIDEHLGDQD